jgi:hypothetical protein
MRLVEREVWHIEEESGRSIPQLNILSIGLQSKIVWKLS